MSIDPDIKALVYPSLKRHEKLLWTGASAGGFRWRLGEYIVIGVGVAFVLLPLVMLSAGLTLWFIFAFVPTGVLLLLGGGLGGWYVRRRSRYALSDRQAFLLFDHPVSGMQVKAYPITRQMNITKVGAAPASVYFATSTRVVIQNAPLRIGFAMIPDADAVYEQMRALQKVAR